MNRTIESLKEFARGVLGHYPDMVYSKELEQDHILKASSRCFSFLHAYKNTLDKLSGQFQANFSYLVTEINRIYTLSFSVKNYFKVCDQIINYRENLTTHLTEICRDVIDFKHSVVYGQSELYSIKGARLMDHILHVLEQVKIFDTNPFSNFFSDEIEKSFIDGSYPQLISYLTHDSTLSLLLHYLQAHPGHVPVEGYTLIIELHKENGQYYLELKYMDGSNHQIKVLPSKLCNRSSNFKFALEDMTRRVEEDLGKIKPCDTLSTEIFYNLLLFMIPILLAFVIKFILI